MAAQITLEDDAISYADWRVPLADVRVIGEFLNEEIGRAHV